MRRPRPVGALLLLAAFGLVGCSQPSAPRPRPDDVIRLQLGLPSPWAVGQPALLTIRLLAQGPNDTQPVMLADEEVPLESTGTAVVTFSDGQPLSKETLQLPLLREC